MSKYKFALNGRDKHIMSLRIVIVLLFIALLYTIWGWKSAPDKLLVHNPPDLRSGSTRIWWDVDPSNVYSFAFYIFQQINNWPKDGEVDFKRNIEKLSPFLTPSCQVTLNEEYMQRKNLGELRGRVRSIGEIVGRGINSTIKNSINGSVEPRVKILSRDAWTATFDFYIDEYYNGQSIKRALARYPLSIVRGDTNPELNPWGLMLNCYAAKPLKLVNGDNNED